MTLEIVGILGGGLILLAFFEVNSGRWNGHSFRYEALNMLGALLLAVYAVPKRAYTNIVLNLMWAAIALYAINHIVERHHARKARRHKKRGA